MHLDLTGIPGLGHEFHVLRVDGPPGVVVGMRAIADPELAQAGIPTVDVLVRDDNGVFTRERIDLGPDDSTFCVSDSFVVVASNSDLDIDTELTGGVRFEPADLPLCNLEGDLLFTFDGVYRSSPDAWPTDHAEVHWDGALIVELSTPSPDELEYTVIPEGATVYSGEGSHWRMQGSFRYERCSPVDPDLCEGYISEEKFAADAFLEGSWRTGFSEEEGWTAETDGWLRAIAIDDEIHLEGALPVTVTRTQRHPTLPDAVTTGDSLWTVSCTSDGEWLWRDGARYSWNGMGRGGEDEDEELAGSWVDPAHSELEFDCRRSWQIDTERDGGTGNTTYSVIGKVRITGD